MRYKTCPNQGGWWICVPGSVNFLGVSCRIRKSLAALLLMLLKSGFHTDQFKCQLPYVLSQWQSCKHWQGPYWSTYSYFIYSQVHKYIVGLQPKACNWSEWLDLPFERELFSSFLSPIHASHYYLCTASCRHCNWYCIRWKDLRQ